MTLKPMAALVIGLLSTGAHAELMQLKFTDTKGTIREVAPADARFVNPTSAITFTASGGLDRKFKLRLLDKAGNQVDEVTTSIISVDDRISAQGKEFYGKSITTNYVPLQTDYQVAIDLLDLQGNVVDTETFNFTVDTTPPEIAEDLSFHILAWPGGSINKFDYLEQREIRVGGISDAGGSGLSRAAFFATLQGTNDERDKPASLDAATGIASWLKPGDYRDLFYKTRSDYTIGFKVYDNAGNEGRASRISSYGGMCGPRKASHIWNPKTSVWDEYIPGMEVYENPFKFRIAVSTADHVNTNGGKFGYTFPPGSQDADNVYWHLTAYMPNTSTYYPMESDTGHCTVIHQNSVNVKLAAGVDTAPQKTGQAYRLQGTSDWVNSESVMLNKPYVVESVRVMVQPRNYEQFAEVAGGTCKIAAGESSCDIAVQINRETGTGYIPYATFVGSTDGRFRSHFGYLYTYWDFDAPEIQNITQTNEFVSYEIFDSNAVGDWRRAWWLPKVMEARAINTSTGAVTVLPLIENNEPNIQLWQRKHSLANLPSGTYKLEIYVSDTYGNERTTTVTESFLKDAVAPTVTFMEGDTPLDNELRGLENLKIILNDPSNPQITQIQLVGGPTSDDVYLAWSKVGENTYVPEYPRIFPAPTADNGYTLKVSVTDAFGNADVKTASFSYYPANLIEVGKTMTLPISVELRSRNNVPIGMITSNVLRTDSGAIATGLQEVHFTLRSDSPYPVKFAGVIIRPGETKKVSIDLGDLGKIHSPVVPAEAKEGEAHFMLDIPQLRSKFDGQ